MNKIKYQDFPRLPRLSRLSRLKIMFTVKAGYADDIEVRSSIDKVREFFSDITNFAELMPGIMQIHTDAKGVAHWRTAES